MQPLGKASLNLDRPTPTAEAQDQKLKQVAELYEKQFLRQMVKAMRSTVSESEFIKAGQGEKIFKEQLDQEYVEKWGDKGGIGLADMIHKQLLEKYGVQLGIQKAPQIPHGPLKLTSRDFITGTPMPSPQSSATAFRLSGPKGQPATVTSPWSGRYLGDFNLSEFNLGDPELHHLSIEHDNGLTSTLSYSGSRLSFPTGHLISSGQDLGQTSLEKPDLIWQIRPN